MTLAPLLDRAKVLVCAGPGGVGKTTTSAALAIQGAYAGKRVIVLTIDPARRLANALGLPEIGNEERLVPAQAFEAAGQAPPPGRMSAMMLDIKRTWDDVIRRYHPDRAEAARLLENRFYRSLSTALAGSQEYMAMEKLHELSVRTEDPLDLIVLDTPPSSHAVDFLEAPSRIIDALDNDATRWLIEPFAGKSGRLLDFGSNLVLRTLGRFTGTATLRDLAELLGAFQGMYEGFRERARAVQQLLAAKDTYFVVVSAPQEEPLAVARGFEERLRRDGIRLGAFVFNRATPDPFAAGPAAPRPLREAVLAAGGALELADRIEAVAQADHHESMRERRRVAHFAGVHGDQPVLTVPELDRDVHDLSGLAELRRFLFPS